MNKKVESKPLKCQRKNIEIKVDYLDEDKTLLKVETPFYISENIPADRPGWVTAPFGGIPYQLDLHCKDEKLESKIIHEAMLQSTWKQFLKEEEKAYENYFTNIFNLDGCFDIEKLRDLLTSKTMILVGGGPSTKENIKELKRISKDNSAFIVAAGSGIRLLLNNNIKPHLALAFDPYVTEWQHVFSKFPKEKTVDIPLACFLGLDVKSYRHWQGPKFISGGQSSMADRKSIDGCTYVCEGGIGVSTMGFHLAEHMNASKLVYVGFDLSYSKKGKKIMSHPDKEKDDLHEIIETEDGKLTNRLWIKEKSFLEMKVANTKKLDMELYNASKQGLELTGYAPIDLSEIVDPSGPIVISGKPLNRQQKRNIQKRLKQLKKEFKSIADLGLRQSHYNTLAYITIFSPYDMVQQQRASWTRNYDMGNIRFLARTLYDVIRLQMNKEGDKHEL